MNLDASQVERVAAFLIALNELSTETSVQVQDGYLYVDDQIFQRLGYRDGLGYIMEASS